MIAARTECRSDFVRNGIDGRGDITFLWLPDKFSSQTSDLENRLQPRSAVRSVKSNEEDHQQ
jgi:hypothetical protein